MTRPTPRPRPARSVDAASDTTTDGEDDTTTDGEDELGAAVTPRRPEPATRRRSSIGRLWTIAVLTVLVLAFVALNIVLLVKRDDHDSVEDARRAAVASAKKRIPAMLSYDYQSISTFEAKAASNATGKFAKTYGDLVRLVIVPSARKQEISTKVSIKSIGVVQASSDDVVLLVLLDQATTNKSTKTPQLQGSRLRATMHDTGGTWLVSDIGQT